MQNILCCPPQRNQIYAISDIYSDSYIGCPYIQCQRTTLNRYQISDISEMARSEVELISDSFHHVI